MISTRLEALLNIHSKQVKVIEEIELRLKDEKVVLHKLLHDLIPDVLAEIGSNEIKVGDTWIRMRRYVTPKINDARYDEALDWIQNSGYGVIKTNCIIPVDNTEELEALNSRLNGLDLTRIFERKIHHKTLEAAVKKMLLDDILIPEHLIAVSIGNFAKID